ncbi:hypothetical protein TNCV_2090061 [Trichonephila clavipes]|nr:hypothetical protein TNCV_2090061 [Trichonephila clavipes]
MFEESIKREMAGIYIRELWVVDLVILNHGQMTGTTPKLASPSPNFPTKSTGRHLSLDRFTVHRFPVHVRSSASGTRLELMTRRPRVRYLDH